MYSFNTSIFIYFLKLSIMSDKICSLLNNTFDNGTVHIKKLEQVIRLLVQKLENNDGNKTDCPRREKFTDPISKLFSSEEAMNHFMCREIEKNPMTEIINLLNITKRIEALEISVHKLTSIVHTFMKHGPNANEKYERTEPVQFDFKKMEQKKSMQEETISNDNENKYLQSKEKVITIYNFDSDKSLLPSKSLTRNVDDLWNQICKNEKQSNIYEAKVNDLFYACEKNEEKTDETILRLDNLKSKFLCQESRLKEMENKLKDIDDRFVTISNACQTLEDKQSNKSFITGDLMERLNEILVELTKIEILEKKIDSLSMIQDSFDKFYDDIKQALTLIKIEIDDKMDKNAHEDFKTCFLNNFGNFIKDLRIILTSFNQNSFGLGTSMSLEPHLNCISCKNNVSMKTEIDSKVEKHLQESIGCYECTKLKPVFQKKKSKKFSDENLLTGFPSPQQFFIITSDNSILKADPKECLKNPSYKRV